MKDVNQLLDRFFQAAERRPQSLFLEAERRVSYAEAAEEVLRRAKLFSSAAESRPVIISGLNGIDWVLDFLAARAAGLVVVPVSHETPVAQLNSLKEIFGGCYMYDPARRTGVLTSGKARKIAPKAAVCLTSSGTTGLPRFALRSELSLLDEGERYLQSLRFNEDDSVIVALPLCHAFTLGLALGGAIAAGCSLHLIERFLPRAVQRLLRREVGTVLPLVPTTARLLCEAFNDGKEQASNLRHVVVGAGPVTSALETDIIQRLGRGPARNYGSSETGATLGTVGEEVPDGVTGSPLPGVEAAIISSSDGEAGALFVRTSERFPGYLTPFGVDTSRVSPDGWYSTGDLATRDSSGRISVTGRLGEGLRRGGRFINPAEVKLALLAHPAVGDAVIIGGRDDYGEDVIEAHVETREGIECSEDELREHLKHRIEPYKMPMVWHVHQSLPRTGGGKPDLHKLRGSEESANSQAPTFFTALAAYRISIAIIVAHRLGILSALGNGIDDAGEIASELGLDNEAVEVLLTVLASAGVKPSACGGVSSEEGRFKPHEMNAVVELEDYLQRTWLSSDAVEEVIRVGVAARAFEADPGGEFLSKYQRVMSIYARHCALYAWRKLRLLEGPVLDIGRPAGAWGKLVSEHAPDRSCITITLSPGHLPFEVGLPDEPLANVFIYNGVRRLAEPQHPLSLVNLRKALHRDGSLVIADVFIDSASQGPSLPTSLMLDWLTHGNLAWPRGVELIASLNDAGFTSIRRIATPSIFELLIAEGRKAEKEK